MGGSESVRLWPGGGGGGLFLESVELLLAGIWEPGEGGEDDNDGSTRMGVNKQKQDTNKITISCNEITGNNND